MSSFWAQNPFNKKDSYAQHALPQLLFRQCHLNCVDSDVFGAEKPSEVACIQNCQEKTYKAFDLYLEVQARQEATKSQRDEVNWPAYSGMEAEHGHDTQSVLNIKQGVHVKTEGVIDFDHLNHKVNGALAAKARGAQ